MMRARLAASLLAALVALGLTVSSASAQSTLKPMQQGTAAVRYDVDSALARATSLRRQNRRPEAAAVVRKALAMAPDRADVRALADQLEHDLHGGEALLGIDYRRWRRQLPEWREGTLAVRQNTVVGPAVGRFSHLERGALGDDKLEIEAYPAFPHGYLALGAGVAPDATLYARSSASAELFAMLAERLEGSVGYRRMNFETGVDLLGGSLSAYAGQFLLGARATKVLNDGGSSVLVSARRFFADDGEYVGVKLGTGSVPVALRTPTDFEVRFSQSVAAEARVVVRGLVVLSAEGELGREGLSVSGSSEYSAVRVGVGLRY